MSNKSLKTFRKLQKQQIDNLKRHLLTELAISLNDLISDEELEPWIEVVDNKMYILKSIQNVATFGTLIATFIAKDNPEIELRLPLQLQLSK
jgi:hypothetical protein